MVRWRHQWVWLRRVCFDLTGLPPTPEQIADFLHQAVQLCLEIQGEHGKMLKDWKKGLVDNPKLDALRAGVEKFAGGFEMPGFTAASVDC